MLRFIYIGNTEKMDQLAGKLFVAASKYELESLKAQAAASLKANLDVQSVADTLMLADYNQNTSLKVGESDLSEGTELFRALPVLNGVAPKMYRCKIAQYVGFPRRANPIEHPR